jgi:hypothetical protein
LRRFRVLRFQSVYNHTEGLRAIRVTGMCQVVMGIRSIAVG